MCGGGPEHYRLKTSGGGVRERKMNRETDASD